jgi:hypothetical protein
MTTRGWGRWKHDGSFWEGLGKNRALSKTERVRHPKAATGERLWGKPALVDDDWGGLGEELLDFAVAGDETDDVVAGGQNKIGFVGFGG